MYNPDRFNSPEYLNVIDHSASDLRCMIRQDACLLIRNSGAMHYPLEACGLLIGNVQDHTWVIDEAREGRNTNTERAADRFQLDPDEYRETDLELSKNNRDIIGIYHSHPDCPAKPSPTDLASAWEGYAYIIVSIHNGTPADLNCWALNVQGNKFCPVPLQEITS